MTRIIREEEETKKNLLLPYAEVIEEEALRHLKEIKTHLGSCILLRELREPLLYWLSRLTWYIELYGLRFSKEDHVVLIQLLYEFITVPDLPLCIVSQIYVPLRKLLRKKKHLIPGEDLILSWRPLYNLCKKIFWSGFLKQTVLNITTNIKLDLEDLVLQVRYYFSPAATSEILDELRPYLCPSDTKAIKFGIQMLSWFLPYSSAALADTTYKLWFDEILRFWDACSNNAFNWEDHMMHLMAWLAMLNVGNIDWEDYIPIMYSRFLRIFKLPVYYKKTGSLKLSNVLEDRVPLWIVSSLGGGSRSQDYLDQLLKTLESYCHSANNGFWTCIIKTFLKKISKFFIIRVKRERFREPFWKIETPEHKKLNDEDIRRFVTSMHSLSMLAMFTPTMFADIASVFQELATLRPDIVVPPLLDKFYSTIDCVTEPHKLTAVLKCVRGVARPMLTHGLNSSFSDGKKHVVPLLFAVLPGIDPNDHQKTMVTLQFICTFLNMIPIVDCSSCSQVEDLTPEEEEVAGTTSQFEEFILQYMERIFVFIESLAQENVRIENSTNEYRSKVEKNVLSLMQGSFMTVFGQLSPSIFMVALKRIYNYSLGKIFEREVAGQAIAVMVKAFARVNGEETYKLFIPKLTSFILESTASQDIKNEEHLDSELLYKMLLLSQVVAGTPKSLLQYIPTLLNVIDETLHLKCKEGLEFSANLLSNILLVYSTTYPINYYDSPPCFDHTSKTSLPVREWGKGITYSELNIQWHSPTEDDISLVEEIFWKYLMPELKKIEKYIKNETEYSRDDIRCTLTVVLSLFSCGNLLAQWDGEPLLAVCESKVPFELVKLNLGVKRFISMPDGSNVYKTLIGKMAMLQSKLLKETDDTVSFTLLAKIWSHLLYYDILLETEYYDRKEFLKTWKSNYVNRAGITDSNMRSVLVEEVALKHIQRIVADGVLMTETHKTVLLNLLDLATCDYKSVQFVARNIVHGIIVINADNSYLVDEIVKNLKVDTSKCSEKFKSTLGLLKARRKKWFSFSDSYYCLKKILPALVTSMPNEEPSIIKLVDDLTNSTVYNQWHYAVHLDIPQNILDVAKKLWSESKFKLLHPIPSDIEIQEAAVRLKIQNEVVKKDYEELIGALLDAVQNTNLQWRYEMMAATFMAAVLLAEEPCPVNVVKYFLRIMVHDLVVFRKIAVKCVVCILKLYKRKTIKEQVDPFGIKTSGSMLATKNSFPGPREDNAWCCYKRELVPVNETQWNEVRYTYKCYQGYYCWPKELYLCSSPHVQPMNTFAVDQLSDISKEIDSFFINESNVDKLIEYFRLEEAKGESLRIFHTYLFKYLFKMHGDRYFEIFRPHFEKLIDHEEESYQRCAAEMIAGMLRGMKVWSFEKSQKMIQWCTPLLRKVLDNMTVETQLHWGSAIAAALFRCDVNKSSYLLELLMEEPIKGDAAFKDCGRLYALQSGILHSWRLSELWCKLLEYVKPHLANPYQNLRERLGSVLVTIFETDIEATNWNRTLSPHVTDFINYLLPKLDILYHIAPNSNDAKNHDGVMNHVSGKPIDHSEAEVQEAIQLLKTVCKWCMNTTQRCVYPLKPDFFKIFPLLCFMENYDKDDELKKCCKHTLSLISFSLVLERDIPVFLTAFKKVSISNSWCAKCTGLDFLQVFAFHNLFLISSRSEWILKIMEIVLELLVDARCEVRQNAGEVLSGFIHHNLIKDIPSMIEKFKKFSNVPLTKKSNLNVRHAGVIGLCAFINAYPYTVPLEVPPLFLIIGEHLKDPEPIPSTIRKTLGNFKRTHYTDWDQSKLQFTPDQLEVFSDIIIPPNHYA